MGTRYIEYCKEKLKLLEPELEKENSILDVGCGSGDPSPLSYLHRELSNKYNVLGVDPNAREKGIVRASASELPFSEGEFDVAICLDVLEHIPDADRIKALKNLLKVARKKVIIAVPTTRSHTFSLMLNTLRRLIGINNPIFEGHYTEFNEDEFSRLISGLNGRGSLRVKRLRYPLPSLLSCILMNLGLLYTSIYIIEKRNPLRENRREGF